MNSDAWPLELRIAPDRAEMRVAYEDGADVTLPAEYLRVFTPSAERVGHGGARIVIGGKAGVKIADVTPVGRYAVRIAFDDGHDTGIYPLDTLRPLGTEKQANWAAYLAELDATGLSRDRPGTAPAPARG